ncbi:lactococcin 972 family bacteriocin [Rathayibacter sp. ZW T2_19]|uniref:Lactococcin 972 family bacteriocin n=1 Tax=Rathayibacter rubneri TaxID=2950106 RepID=A0A9X2E2G9_9MICO|nr:lactococcin 972 family bacteriocin [Rathayibacter rubneri]MCM6763171.1 lactococcin 972 family bacteriocin [Rathayibacter rubneri]
MDITVRTSRFLAALAVAVVVAATAATTASATTTYPDGGTWKYGIREYSSTPYLYSEYFHASKTHKASTITSRGVLSSSGWVVKGLWAKAPEKASNYSTSTNHWYYNV